MILISFDLKGAEWNIVAYDSGDESMIAVAEGTTSSYAVTGSLISGLSDSLVEIEDKLVGKSRDRIQIAKLREKIPDIWDLENDTTMRLSDAKWLPETMSIRQMGKRSNLALNYGMQVPTFARTADISEKEAKRVRILYTETAYPGLPDYWRGIKEQLTKDKTLTNCFGRKVKFLPDWQKNLEDAYAFIPQSTVADIVLDAMTSSFEDPQLARLECYLAQVHDELLSQTEANEPEEVQDLCRRVVGAHMSPTLHYSGRDFVLDVGIKIGRDWSEQNMIETTLDGIPEAMEGL